MVLRDMPRDVRARSLRASEANRGTGLRGFAVMTWNYRVVRSKDVDGSDIYALHECYYDKDGRIEGVTHRPVALYGFESVKDLVSSLGMMLNDASSARLRRTTRHSVLSAEDIETAIAREP